ncbi:hypothetical protein [Oryzihumus leptocrescens]|uniref:Uncharacterized protein n=1 Tax=Oryzihumus leptocrescens TaxID=297536 RepID=A0A542ZIG2_9MICO|nr:hypothetical protein [Oryzihumus leptocrescens]TQL60116.1 hypothetical protein FB474_1498 [Oryzihumus leptocrescens]
MITSPGSEVLLSNLGWVDKGSIWRLDTVKRVQDRVPVGDAGYLRLAAGESADSVVVQHGLRGRLSVSVHPWSSLADPLVRVDVHGWTAHVEGDLNGFRGHARLFVAFLDDAATGAGGYYLTEVGASQVSIRRLDWFDQQKYDPMYQQVLSAVELPSGEYLFGIQRCSDLVLCDPIDLSVIREVPLAGRLGNPVPFLRAGGTEVWAVDYDTVVRLDAASLGVEDRWLGQPPANNGHRMFLGDLWMSRDEQEILAPRPGSGDVVSLDPGNLRVARTWVTSGRPLTAAVLDGQLLARDWKTGDLLSPIASG